ncbi:MAG: arginase family protein [Bacteroidales bacterium]|nr:arginase family protein [Tenuifilaceae bacterium]
MNLADYFNASEATPAAHSLPKSASIFGKLQSLATSPGLTIENGSLVMFGVGETRNSNNPGAAHSAELIRPYLFGLSGAKIKHPIIDLGNLKLNSNTANTYMAVRDVVEFIQSKGATCIILGGTQELTWPIFLATSQSVPRVNLSIIDYTIDMGLADGDFSSTCYIDKIINDGKKSLFNLSMLGYQGYLVDSKHIDQLTAYNFELSRLGFVRGAMSEIDATLRDSHIVSLDMACVKQSDSPGVIYPSPNGFYSEEICQLARYSGVGSNTKAFGLFELNTLNDPFGVSASLAAHIIWHFIDGFNVRDRFPSISESKKDIKRFYVKSPIPNIELVFVQNTVTGTWWFELPPTKKSDNHSIAVACSYNDYLKASKGDVPDRWLRAWKRIS